MLDCGIRNLLSTLGFIGNYSRSYSIHDTMSIHILEDVLALLLQGFT